METANLKDFLNIGFAGAVTAWFLMRTDKRLERLSDSLNRLTRGILTLAESPHFDETTKRRMRRLLEDGETPE